MNKTIWKFQLVGGPGGGCIIPMPSGAEIVMATDVQARPTLWAEVDPNMPKVNRRFGVVGTGWPLEEDAEYLGTYFDGPFVWHIYELPML